MPGSVAVIDIENDELMTINDAREWIAGRTGSMPTRNTLQNWIGRGMQDGHKLEVIRIGVRVFTSMEALKRFMTRHEQPEPEPVVVSKRRRREMDEATRRLDEILGPV
jgi:hypothetical protein